MHTQDPFLSALLASTIVLIDVFHNVTNINYTLFNKIRQKLLCLVYMHMLSNVLKVLS